MPIADSSVLGHVATGSVVVFALFNRNVKMSEPLIIVRGHRFSAEHLPLDSPKFAEDARAVLELSDEELDRVATELARYPGFLDGRGIAGIVATCTTSKNPNRVAALIRQVDRWWRQSDRKIDDFVSDVQRALSEQEEEEEAQKQQGLSRSERERLAERLPKFLAAQPLARQWKAERIANGTGSSLDELQIYCDTRPVFSDDRAKIDGMVLLTTLRVVSTDVNGLSSVTEVRLSRTQLEELSTKATGAREKLTKILDLMNEKDIIVPHIGRKISEDNT
ncbi:hypothetical protein LZC95_48910 [Pendulispora brunnea]|uniref:Uncharacterized protein n=1 Tax=Pendulispora brunnea TaxID=2905690 RepID=A0ABZ2KB87_9BACT